MALGSLLFFLFITVQQDHRGEKTSAISEVANVLNTGAPGVKIVHAVKVAAELNFYAFVEVQNISALDGFARRLWRIRQVTVLSRPIIDGKTFAKNIGVPENLTLTNSTLSKERLFFQEINIQQGGKTTEEFLDLLRQEFELLYTLESRGELSIVLFKALEGKTLYVLVNIPDAPEFDLQINFFPLSQEHGPFTNIFVKGVQFVSEFVAVEGQEEEYEM